MDKRFTQLSDWLTNNLSLKVTSIEPASADASFRRYFRVKITPGCSKTLPHTFIAMDSPPEYEDNALFVRCTDVLKRCGLHVPTIFEKNLSQGFLAISDLGTQVFQNSLNEKSADQLYGDAMQSLLKMQSNANLNDAPKYNAQKLGDEIQLFEDWYIQHYHQISLNTQEQSALKQAQQLLISNALEQPQVLVHRDYHCRNLLVTTDNNPGIIDYQDMLIGPITYDLVSLFKDCYIQWPTTKTHQWIDKFQQHSLVMGIHGCADKNQWRRWFDLMGIQRHLKVLGIFSRLYFRDNKDQYLNDIPLTYEYLINTSEQYVELQGLTDILKQHPAKKRL